jgi:hypothetical protein
VESDPATQRQVPGDDPHVPHVHRLAGSVLDHSTVEQRAGGNGDRVAVAVERLVARHNDRMIGAFSLSK